MSEATSQKIPVTVLTGYLGVGVPCSVNRRGWKTESMQGFESMCLVPCL